MLSVISKYLFYAMKWIVVAEKYGSQLPAKPSVGFRELRLWAPLLISYNEAESKIKNPRRASRLVNIWRFEKNTCLNVEWKLCVVFHDLPMNLSNWLFQSNNLCNKSVIEWVPWILENYCKLGRRRNWKTDLYSTGKGTRFVTNF